MKRKKQLAVWALAGACSFSALSFPTFAAQDDSTASTKTKAERIDNLQSSKSLGQVERANKLIGREVIGSDSQKLGKLDNLIVDLESGRILYAVIGSGGVAGVGEKKFAVSPGVFTEMQAPSESKKLPFEHGPDLRANIDKAKLNGAPQFTKDIDKDMELSKADFLNQVYQYFGETAWWQGANAPASAGEFQNVHKASDLIGMKVQNASDQPMGKLDNLAADLPAGRIVYVILSPDSSLDLGSDLYALPPSALALSTDKKKLTSDISKEKLAGAPHFAKDNWTNLSDPSFASQVYQYYGKQAYFEAGSSLKPTGPSDQRTYPAPKKEQ
jgi:sporulation protein YlmC with PRC-barrel domain